MITEPEAETYFTSGSVRCYVGNERHPFRDEKQGQEQIGWVQNPRKTESRASLAYDGNNPILDSRE